MDLGLNDAELNQCVQCGLCLSSCPTYRITGDETMSPRGRIALMRMVQWDGAPLTEEIANAFDSCIQCRACEPACPSEVPYGALIEQTRATMHAHGSGAPIALRASLWVLGHPRLLRVGSAILAVIQRLVPLPSSLGLPRRIPIRRQPIRSSGDDVILFTGCVMDVWQRDVHAATIRVLEAAGFGVHVSGDSAPCCGALHGHSGLASSAHGLAEQVIARLPDDAPILVNSAGCGAAMKGYANELGTSAAKEFSSRVFDVQEWLSHHVDRLPMTQPLEGKVAVQDPCHLRHVQRVHPATRTVLRPFVTDLVELDDEGLCCGAGGAYSLLQPELAGLVRERKLESIDRSAPLVVASSNPGCSIYLASAGVRTLHPMQIIDLALAGGRL